MPFDIHDPMQWIVAGSAFVLVFSLWLGVLLFLGMRRGSRTRRIEERLETSGKASTRSLSLWVDDREVRTVVEGRRRVGLLARLDRLLKEAGWTVSAPALVLGVVLGGVFGTAILFAITKSVLPGAALSGLVVVVTWFLLNQGADKRRSLFERQLLEALDLAARSLRAGHPLGGAFQLISQEVPAPVGRLFLEICEKQTLGMSLDEALASVAASNSSADLTLFATSVIIQLRSGGHLADMMDRLAHVIRDRIRLNRRVKVLTAQTQFSKRVLLSLPFIIFFALNLLYPDYMVPLYSTPRGRLLLAAGGGALLLGSWTMNRLAVLKY